MITRISTKGQIVIPSELRKRDGLQPGQEFEIDRQEDGSYRVQLRAPENGGLLEWLMACPVNNFLDDVSASDSTRDCYEEMERPCR